MIYFLDTSALVKRYVSETGSDQVQRLLRRRVELAISRITEAEAYAAIARATRMGAIGVDERDRVFEQLAEDVATMRTVEIRRGIVTTVRDLVERWPLRGYDAIQLACALRIHSEGLAVDLWCSDGDLAKAARREGLRTTEL